MLEAGAHFGHQARRWNPQMAPYLHAVKDGVHVFDLIKTRQALIEALTAITKAVKEKKVILLVGTKKQASLKLKEVAQAIDMPYVDIRWLGGTLTNFAQIDTSIKRLEETKKNVEEGVYKDYTKKEKLLIDRSIAKLEKKFGGIVSMKKAPDLLFILDTKRESGAVREAKRMGIPVIGVVDSNSDPADADYPIPMNDDATKSIDFVLDLVKVAALEGK